MSSNARQLAANLPREGGLSNRNLIINGAMQVAQRGTSVSVSQGSNGGYQTVDRFRFDIAGTGVATVSQSTDAPAGFKNSHKIEVTTTNASPTGTDYNTLQTRIEGQNAVQCGFGTSNAQQMTLSFYVKSSLTGLFGGSIANSAANRSYPFGYTINSANTWERKTITFTADTTGTWSTDNTTGPKVMFGLGLASYFLGTDGAWSAADKHGVTGQINLFATNGATWQITGVQLEVGDTATPFEHRSYGDELQACRRYYHSIGTANYGGGYELLAHGFCDTTTSAIHLVHLPVQLRASPTLKTSGDYTKFYWRMPIGSPTTTAATALPTIGQQGLNCVRFDCSGSSMTVGYGCFFSQNNDTTAYIAFDAEL